MNLYWAGPLEGHFKNFDFRGVGGGGGGGGGVGGWGDDHLRLEMSSIS